MTRAAALAAALFLLAGALLPYDPVADVHPALADHGPALSCWLGTDALGRDVSRRLLSGGGTLLSPALAAALAAALGVLAAGGLHTRWPRARPALRIALDALSSLPPLLWVLLAAALRDPSPLGLGVAAGVAAIPSSASLFLARIEGLSRLVFFDAARCQGIARARVRDYHLVWVHGWRPACIAALQAASAWVMIEATLSYLGQFGVQEPTPSWGNMIAFSFGRPNGNPLAWMSPALAVLLAAWGLLAAARRIAHDLP